MRGTITLTEKTTWPDGATITRTITGDVTAIRALMTGHTPARLRTPARGVVDSEALWTSEQASKRAMARLEAT